MEAPHAAPYPRRMIGWRPDPGHSLIELLFVVCVVAVLLGLAAPALGTARDRYAVRAARDALAAGIARGRAFAVVHGGAVVVVDPAAGRLWIERRGGEVLGAPVELARRFGVTLSADGAEGPARIRFDGMGIGRLANRTLRIRRGSAEAGITISAYGRVRTW